MASQTSTCQGALQLARENQRRQRVFVKLVPEASRQDFSKFAPLLEYPLLGKNAADRHLKKEVRHLARNQLHYLSLCKFMLTRMCKSAQKAAPLEREHYLELKQLILDSLKSKPVPFNPAEPRSMREVRAIVPLADIAELSQKAGAWRLLEFMDGMEAEMERVQADFPKKIDARRLVKRMQAEHVLAHAVIFITFYEREMHCQQLRLASETVPRS